MVRGAVRDAGGAPIASAVVRLASELNEAVGASGLTGEDGRFNIRLAPERGRFLLTAHRLGFPPTSLVVSLDTADRAWTVVMRPALVTLDPLVTSVKRIQSITPRRDPGSSGSGLSSATALRYPYDMGDLAALATFLNPSIIPLFGDDGSPLGLAVAGQQPGAVNITLDGSTTDNLTLPAEAMSAVRTFITTYDVSRGQFTSALIAGRTRSGTDIPQGIVSLKGSQPLVGASREGRGSTVLWDPRAATLSGGAGGPLVRQWLYAYAAADVTRSESAPPSVLDGGTRSASLFGVSQDSVQRFLDIAQRIGLGPTVVGSVAPARTTSANAVLRLDSPLTANHTATLRADWLERRSTSASPLSVSGSAGARLSGNRGLYLALTSTDGPIQNEARVYFHSRASHGDPTIIAPQAAVRVGSMIEDSLALAILTAGGNSAAYSWSDARAAEVSDDFSWAPGQRFARVITGFVARRERAEQRRGSNPFGNFTFASLSDFELGRPLSFSRVLDDGIVPEARADYAAGYLGAAATLFDANLTFGLRAEVQRYGRRDTLAADAFGVATSARSNIPTDVLLSPRIGFRVTPSTSLAVYGGSGVFRAASRTASLVGPLGETGTSATRRLICVGASAPTPAWAQYLADPAGIPVTCSDEQSVFASSRPVVTVFDPAFRSPRMWRSSVGALANVGALNSFSIEASLATSGTMPLAFDRNLNDVAAFTLGDEADRPVFVAPGSIDPAGGGASFGASRRNSSFGLIREMRARGRSSTFQLSSQIGGILPWTGQSGFGALSYAFTAARLQTTGISAPGAIAGPTAADPNGVAWSPAPNIPQHSVDVTVGRSIRGSFALGIIGSFRSGVPFTPLTLGDVNGDGLSNDRAFVFDPTQQAGDTAIQGAMQKLLGGSSSVARCLTRQRGRVADAGSCRTAWSRSVNASVSYRMRSTGASATLSAFNLLAALDRGLHGRDHARGWGSVPVPDENLLIVRGFDATRNAYRYQVNPNFGAPRPDITASSPFMVQIRMRFPFGADPARPAGVIGVAPMTAPSAAQEMEAMLRSIVVNTPARLLTLNAERSLTLTPAQVIRLHLAMDSLQSRIDANVAALGRSLLDDASARTADRLSRRRALKREAQGLISAGVTSSREILGELQWGDLPDVIRLPSQSIPDGVVRSGRRPP